MFTIEGQNATAYIMSDYEHISDGTISQIHTLVSHPSIQNDFVVQADGHKASGAVVGFTMPLGTRLSPVLVGDDIGCGMRSVEFETDELPMEGEERDSAVRSAVPMGRGTNSLRNSPTLSECPWDRANRLLSHFKKEYRDKFSRTISPSFHFSRYDEEYVSQMCERVGLSFSKVRTGIGTLGAGNHFIEFGQSEKTDNYWQTIHTGSRFVGKAIGKYYTKQAHNNREGDENRGSTTLDWLEDTECDDYFIDMIFAQVYAEWNRRVISERIQDALGLTSNRVIDAPHNYIDFNDMIVRKGATAAREGEELVIPFNMSDGVLICVGRGSSSHRNTAPHGAGRIVSRNEAKNTISLEKFENRMSDVYSERVTESMLAESPQAYKDVQYIKDEVEKTATIKDRLRPIHNLKG